MIRCQVVSPIKAETSWGILKLSPGQIITIPEGEAQDAIAKGKLRPYPESPASTYEQVQAAIDDISRRLSAECPGSDINEWLQANDADWWGEICRRAASYEETRLDCLQCRASIHELKDAAERVVKANLVGFAIYLSRKASGGEA